MQECPQSTAGTLLLKSEVAPNEQECSGPLQPRGEEEQIPLPGLSSASPQEKGAWQGTSKMVTWAGRTLACSESSGTICHSGRPLCWLHRSCLFLNDSAFSHSACISDDDNIAMTAVGGTACHPMCYLP